MSKRSQHRCNFIGDGYIGDGDIGGIAIAAIATNKGFKLPQGLLLSASYALKEFDDYAL